jgi:hypothetical protein
MALYPIKKDIDLSPKKGDQLAKFGLNEMEVGDAFVIPYTARKIKNREVLSPEKGINIKEANKRYAPKEFTKRRRPEGIVVGRIK